MAVTFTDDQLAKATRLKHLNASMTRVKSELDALDAAVVKSVALDQKATPNTGYAASYTLSVNGTALATEINIPKDFLVKSATLETVTAADTPYSGAVVGDKYIDFVINAKDAPETAEHIYLPVNDLVDVYTAGNGLTLSNGQFSVVVDSTSANGLTSGANGIALAGVTASTSGAGGTNGAMLATDKEKLDGISTGANKVTVTTEKAGTIEIDGTSKTIVEFATDQEVTDMQNNVFGE